jgi:hypothetical protein
VNFKGYTAIVLKVLSNWEVIVAIVLAIVFIFAANYLGDLYRVYHPRPKQPKQKKAATAAEAPAGEEAAAGEQSPASPET